MKTMGKCFKILSGILITIILLNVLIVPIESFAEEINNTYTVDGVTATLANDGTLTISGTGTIKQVLIRKFDYQNAIKKVVINNGITSIGEGAFYWCKSLESINIPEGVVSLEKSAFDCCESLKSIIIPRGVTSIGDSAFRQCSSLINIEIPDGVTSIGNGTFARCESLKNINIPEGVTSIGSSAFLICSSLTSINVPNSVTNIGESAFSECSALKSIIIPEGVTSIGNRAFYECSALESITISEGVKSIGEDAFYKCSSLTSIEIPKGVTNIGECAFWGCGGLRSVVIQEGVTSIGESAFRNCSALESIIIPEGVTSIESNTFYDCENLKSIIIPSSVTSIGEFAFSDCIALESITIQEGVTSIGSSAFLICSSLTSINVPNSVTNIGESAFDGCWGLISITIPNSVTSIGEQAFFGCSKDFEICCKSNSKAKEYAEENDLDYVIDDDAPIISGNIDGWTKNNVTLTIEDENCGLKEVTVNGEKVAIGEDGKVVYTISKSGEWTVVAKDYLGNTSQEIVKIDKIKPTIKVMGNPNIWTKDDVILTIEANDDESGLSNVTVNGQEVELENGEGTYKVTQNGTYKVVATDNVGNKKEESVIVSKIDKIEPILEIIEDPTIWTKNDVTLTIEAQDNESGLNNVTVNGQEVELDDDARTYIITTNGVYKIVATDNVGNKKEESVTVSNIDKISPTLEVIGNPTSWTKDDVLLTIEANDDESGLSNVTVNDQEIELENGEGTYKVTKNGTYTIVATDNAGNTIEEEVVVNKIDKTGLSCEVEYSTTNPTNGNVKVTIKVNKEVSAIDGWTLSKDKMELTKTYSSNKEEQVTLQDSLGNSVTAKIKIINIDKTAPTLEVTKNPTSWTKNDVILTIEALDNESGLNNVTVDEQEIELENGEGTYKVTKNGIYNVVATDNAGNTKEQLITVNNIDKIEPTLEVTGNPTSWIKDDVTLTIEAGDTASGLNGVTVNGQEVELENGEGTYNATKNGTYTIIATDRAGNIKEEIVTVSKIDKTVPVISNVTKTPETLTSEGVTLEVEAEDKESGIKEYSFDGGATWQTNNQKIYNKNTNGIKVQVKDNAGNVTEYSETINITNIKDITDIVEIKNYTLENNMLKGIEPGTILENLTKNVIIKDAEKVKILNKENKEIKTGEKITTGSKVQINAFGETIEYKIVVTGDTTGDGQADYNDMMKVNLHRLNKIQLQGEYFEAGDINKDGKVDFTDFIKINLFRLKKIDVL